jgi:hypothetical protein
MFNIDAQNKLIAEFEVTNEANDKNCITPFRCQALLRVQKNPLTLAVGKSKTASACAVTVTAVQYHTQAPACLKPDATAKPYPANSGCVPPPFAVLLPRNRVGVFFPNAAVTATGVKP